MTAGPERDRDDLVLAAYELMDRVEKLSDRLGKVVVARRPWWHVPVGMTLAFVLTVYVSLAGLRAWVDQCADRPRPSEVRVWVCDHLFLGDTSIQR